eukprot:GCRY01001985.1.p1 GENE.GCRY01001985.1~~GCRY01001985.1.p1  ORF type:complete len:137 (+),score=14.63 GCRY01001985.1:247-657(+)
MPANKEDTERNSLVHSSEERAEGSNVEEGEREEDTETVATQETDTSERRRKRVRKDRKKDIEISVMTPKGDLLTFRVRRSTPIQKIIKAYCDSENVEQSTVRLLYDSELLKETDTPKDKGMADGTNLVLMISQTGG